MTEAEKTRCMEQRTSNYGQWQRGNDGADDNNNKTTINKCAAAEVEDNDDWQEVGWGGVGGGATVVRLWRRHSFAIRSWKMEVEDGRGCVHLPGGTVGYPAQPGLTWRNQFLLVTQPIKN